MTNLESVSSPSIHSEDRAHEAEHPTSTVARFGMRHHFRLRLGTSPAHYRAAFRAPAN